MKRILYILLIGTLLVSCIMQPDEIIPDGFVKTRFTLAVPNSYGAQSRMSGPAVMNDPANFSGMQDIRIFPFHSSSKDAGGEYTILSTTPFTGFTTVVAGGANNLVPSFDNTDLLHLNQANDKWYVDLHIPAGTNSLLIYGKRKPDAGLAAVGVETPAEKTSAFTNGHTTASFALSNNGDLPNLIRISHTRVYGTDDLIAHAEADLLVALLNQVLAAQGYETEDGSLEKWANGDNLLSATYTDMTTLTAGNSTHILCSLEQLYNACAKTIAMGLLTAPVSQPTLPEAIQTAITTPVSDGAGNRIGIVAADDGLGGYILSWKTDDGCTDPAFPARYSLPEGVVQLRYTPSGSLGLPGTFSYSTDPAQYGIYALDYRQIVYPSELWYRANTSIRTSVTEQKENVASQTWPQFITNNYGNTAEDRLVRAQTKSVAAVRPLQYAVGRLDTYVHFEPGTLYARDPKAPTDGALQQAVNIPVGGFRIVGLLIGGQPAQVGWQFQPDGLGTCTVYDRVMTTMTGATTESVGTSDTYVQQSAGQPANPFTRTLLFESRGVPLPGEDVVAETNDEVINLALEMENNSDRAFYGEDGLIPVGGHFYLIAQLRLSDNAVEANTRGLRSIFAQDYITIANATIHTLKHAYCTVPNLTVPSQELGVSIDLQWKQGAIIDTTIR